MASAYSSSAYRASRRSRGPGIALAIVVNLLLALLFLTMSSYAPFSRMAPTGLSVFNVSGSRPAPEATKKKAVRRPRHTKRSATTPKTATPPPPKPPAPDASAPTPFKMIIVSKEVFAASDIGKLPMHEAEAASGGGHGDAAKSASTYGPGEGPGGSTLYAADWYRKPRHSELAYYMPEYIRPGSWAEIACQTVEHYGVENCRTLGESPRGSGLANALRRAAWQFKVIPPRKDGKPMLHAWVRIHFDFTDKARD
jgi:hypothetical protein